MRVLLIVDAWAPLRTSAAVQMGDLAEELVAQGHEPTVLVPTPGLERPWTLAEDRGATLLRVRAPTTKDVGYVRRTLAEGALSAAALAGLLASPLRSVRWEGLVWYSPTIFFGPLIHALKRRGRCRSYLILRDIFPEWAADAGLMGRGAAFRAFKAVERVQYAAADVVGVQTPANLAYMKRWARKPHRRVEVLNNWLRPPVERGVGVDVSSTSIGGRTVFVYAGNMGVAQDMDCVLDLAEDLREREDVGLLLVGRGSEVERLGAAIRDRELTNVVLHPEVAPADVPGLLAQCDFGLLTLHRSHRTHNIPGKFVAYMYAGLPVFASINPGNDLEPLIRDAEVGVVTSDGGRAELLQLAEQLLASDRGATGRRARALAEDTFSAAAVVRQLVAGLEG